MIQQKKIITTIIQIFLYIQQIKKKNSILLGHLDNLKNTFENFNSFSFSFSLSKIDSFNKIFLKIQELVIINKL